MGLKILVVDDEPILLQFVADLLNLEGHFCITAENGLQALQKFSTHEVDIILTDQVMPELDGIGLIKEIRKLSQVPIVMYTGCSIADQALQAGANLVLLKPSGLRGLAGILEKVAGLHNPSV